MSIELHMRPDIPPMSGVEFRQMAGPFSIAIDGFVKEGPWYDATLPSKNFNHHEGVARLETRATCAQVLVSVRQGFFKRFRDQDGPRAEVYANDCDEDVCLSWFLLRNHALAAQTMNPMLNRLVYMVDLMDTTAGAYPFPEDLQSLHGLAWVFEPYRRFRFSGGLASRDPSAFRSIVTDVEHRISAYISGQGREIPLDIRYEMLSTEVGWAHVKELGTQARIGMFSDGVRAFVSSSPYGNEGRWMHIIGRMSEYIDFPVIKLLEALNRAEGLTGADRWGGGDTIGGSPRISGSKLTPPEVAAVVRSVLGGTDFTRGG
jgi:hypothetical protein